MEQENNRPRPHPALEALVEAHARLGDWPGGVYAAGPPGPEPCWWGAAGRLALEPEPEPARPDALYDLASLTKPLVTAALAVRLAGRGGFDLAAPLDRWLPEMRGYAGKTPSWIDLLAHRSGLPAWAPLYRLAGDPGATAAVVAGLSPVAAAGERPVYSCLGPILAGIALERLTGVRLRELFAAELAGPLGLDTGAAAWSPVQHLETGRIAPTEKGRVQEASLAPAPAGDPGLVPGQDRVLRGEVNDGNAAFLGGAAGNAGLFATSRACFRLASALAGWGGLFDSAQGELFFSVLAEDETDARAFGLQSGRRKPVLAGKMGPGSFGHAGFTGTSFWIDPQRGLVAVLLTNALHPHWRELPIQGWRGAFHSLVVDLAAGERL